MSLVVDSGALYALYDADDRHYQIICIIAVEKRGRASLH